MHNSTKLPPVMESLLGAEHMKGLDTEFVFVVKAENILTHIGEDSSLTGNFFRTVANVQVKFSQSYE